MGEPVTRHTSHVTRHCSSAALRSVTSAQGSNYFGAVHDEAQETDVGFYSAHDVPPLPHRYGSWSEETRDVLEGASCGHKLPAAIGADIRVKEAAQVLARLLVVFRARARFREKQ